jgi:hypothetical protein
MLFFRVSEPPEIIAAFFFDLLRLDEESGEWRVASGEWLVAGGK